MQVFKAFLHVLRKRMPSICIYFGVFFAILVILSFLGSNSSTFSETKLNVCVIDLDNTYASGKLTEYIGSNHTIMEMDTDEDSVKDALFNQLLDCVITINKGYSENMVKGDTDGLLDTDMRKQSYSGALFGSQIEQYVSDMHTYIMGGYTIENAADTVNRISAHPGTKVTMKSFDENNCNVPQALYYFFSYLPYILISIMISGLCPVLITLNEKEIRNRTNCAPISTKAHTFQIILGSLVFVGALWLVFMFGAFILFGGDLFTSKALLSMLNSIAFLAVSAGIAILIATLSPKSEVVDMVGNVVGLGMSFLCGVFVPQMYLADSVLAIGRFLPAYWYVKANDMICGMSAEIFDNNTYLICIGVQLLFAVALFSIVLVIVKTRRSLKR